MRGSDSTRAKVARPSWPLDPGQRAPRWKEKIHKNFSQRRGCLTGARHVQADVLVPVLLAAQADLGIVQVHPPEVLEPDLAFELGHWKFQSD